MQIPCSETGCFYQDFGECLLTRATTKGGNAQKCPYYRPKHPGL